MNGKNGYLLGGALVLLAGGGYYYYTNFMTQAEAPAPTPPPRPVAVAPAPTTPAIRYPVPTETPVTASTGSASPLPQVDDSDPSLMDALTQAFGQGRFKLLNLDNLVRRFVVNVDNATKSKPTSSEYSLFKFPESSFLVKDQGERAFIAEKNFNRYMAYLKLIEGIDEKKLVQVYVHYYPLFQSAYRDINPKGYFNDRLVEVLDSLLATPVAQEPLELIAHPATTYKYLDFKLESLPAAQKVLLRAGPKTTAAIEAKLRRIRELVTHFSGH